MDEELQSICERITGWRGRNIESITPLDGGYTNRNYSVLVDGEWYALRVGGDNAEMLGIDRKRELAVLNLVSRENVFPEISDFLLPEGHLVTRFVAGEKWTPQEFRTEPVLELTATVLRKIHSLPPLGFRFSPYSDIRSRLESARRSGIPLPSALPGLMKELERIERSRSGNKGDRLCLCHNDAFLTNFLHNGHVWLLDWEYAGDGDPLYDIASTCLGCDAGSTRHFLERYGEPPSAPTLEAIEDQRYVVRFWNGMWALLQAETPQANEAYDYDTVVKNVFRSLATHVAARAAAHAATHAAARAD